MHAPTPACSTFPVAQLAGYEEAPRVRGSSEHAFKHPELKDRRDLSMEPGGAGSDDDDEEEEAEEERSK